MITKVSEITYEDIADYLRLSEVTAKDIKFLNTILNVAKDYIKNNSGIENMDAYSDLVVAVFVLCQDMYDNRALYVDKNNVNIVVSNIINEHSDNLL